MKYYKNLNDEIYAYEDDINNDFLVDKIEELSLTAITEDEVATLRKQKEDAYKTTDEYLSNLAISIRAQRDSLMQDAQNRVDRYNRETAMGFTPVDNLTDLYNYMHLLAILPEQTGFPTDVTWPIIP